MASAGEGIGLQHGPEDAAGEPGGEIVDLPSLGSQSRGLVSIAELVRFLKGNTRSD
jgi:hypothetical protein